MPLVLPTNVFASLPITEEEFNTLNNQDQIESRETLTGPDGKPYVYVRFRDGRTTVMDPEPPGIVENLTARNILIGITGLSLIISLIFFIRSKMSSDYDEDDE